MAQTWTISNKDYVMLAQFTNEDSNFIANDEHFISVDTPSSYYQFDCLINHELAKYMVVGNHVILRDKEGFVHDFTIRKVTTCLLYTSPSPRDRLLSRMPSSA